MMNSQIRSLPFQKKRVKILGTLYLANQLASFLDVQRVLFRAIHSYETNVETPQSHKIGTCNEIPSEHEDFFRYTSGRWVWDEEQQLRDRYKAFNIRELQNIAAEAVGSRCCVAMTKLTEGEFNEVFRLRMDDSKTVIARIPNPNTGPTFYTIASEVATMDLVGRTV